jgi:hypothetical protein
MGLHLEYVNDNPEVTTEGCGCYDYKPYMMYCLKIKLVLIQIG